MDASGHIADRGRGVVVILDGEARSELRVIQR